MLSTAVEKAPSSKDWVHEVKYDGYRVQVRIDNGQVKLLTRQGLDWTERFTGVAAAVGGLPLKAGLIGGEVGVQTGGGVRSEDDVRALREAGATRVVIGSLAISQPRLVASWLQRFGGEADRGPLSG